VWCLKKVIVYFIILIIALVLQITIFSAYPLYAVSPDIMLVVVILTGIVSGLESGSGIGLAAGSLQDVFISFFPGIYSFTKIISGFIAGFLGKLIFKENYFFPPLIIFFITILHSTLVLFLKEGLVIDFWEITYSIIILEAAYNAVIGILLYPVFYKYLNLGDKESWINV